MDPPDPLCVPIDDDSPFKLKPIKFWSYERWGVATPCANEGFNHSVTLGVWRMRRVKDVFDDFYLAGRRTLCSACKARKQGLLEERNQGRCKLCCGGIGRGGAGD